MSKHMLSAEALSGSAREFVQPAGADLLSRVAGFARWQETRRAGGCWSYSKAVTGAPRATCEITGDAGETFSGVNFGSQDYLSLASHPAILKAAKDAVDGFGVHSAGSAALLGNTSLSLNLERVIAAFLGGMDVVLYPTGWAAGYGAVQGLVRADDHIVMDVLAHACMQEGARAATRNIHLHGHRNVESAARKLRQIREKDRENGILVITESLFSMHSDTPDLAELKRACERYGATLLVDAAHDLGSMGEGGHGLLGLQNMLSSVDVIVGSFSKTFAANGGFVAVRSPAVKEYLKYYSASQTFSNALSPIQAAVVTKAFEIVASEEGRLLRQALMDNVLYLRREAAAAGLEVLGDPSPIVPIQIGAEGIARRATTRLAELGAIANLVEYPAVPKGNARLRVQVMAAHSRQDIDHLVAAMRRAVSEAEQEVSRFEAAMAMVEAA